MDNIRQFIEEKIKSHGFTKKEVAEKMGVHPANLNKMIESPSFPTLEKLSEALGISMSELLQTEEDTDKRFIPRSSDIKLEIEGKRFSVLLMPESELDSD